MSAPPLNACQMPASSSSTCGGIVIVAGPAGLDAPRLGLDEVFVVTLVVATLVVAFFVVATSGPRMGSLVRLEEPGAGHVRVALRRRDRRVTQKLLYRADVGSPFQQVRRE